MVGCGLWFMGFGFGLIWAFFWVFSMYHGFFWVFSGLIGIFSRYFRWPRFQIGGVSF